MRWAGNVARTGRGELYIGIWWGNLRERDHLGDPGVDGRIILRWILRCVIPVLCLTNEREESVVNQHN